VTADGWYNDPTIFFQRLAEHDNKIPKLSLATGVPRQTLNSAKERHLRNIGGPAANEIPVTLEHLKDLDQMIQDRGLVPSEWRVDRVKVNEWTAADGSLAHQLVGYLKPRVDLEMLAPAVDVRPIAPPRKPDRSKPRLVVFVGDEQEPYSDPVLKGLFLDWLAFNKPDEGVHLGDLMDFPTISRHRDNPAYAATPQECINAGYATLRSYREASPQTAWKCLRGNHDDRLRAEQLSRAERIYGLRPADYDEQRFEQALSLRHLLHLDDLGIVYVGDDGQYEQSEVEVAPDLVARHGWITGSNSAEKTLRKVGCDVVVGHTHRQVITWATEVRRGKTLVTQAVEAGCMCRVEGGLGYTVNANWQQGFATAVVWPDGSHVLELASFVDGSLRWRDQRYTAKRLRAA
jgi:predicted phosphodiesterase